MIAQLPADEAVRRRLREDFDTTFFVEAGAGTGKTTTLVDRIVALVASGRLRAPELVAITFTEAAAAELRAAVREELEKDGSPAALAAAASLDEAAIDTIHAFAGSLLRTYPLEAGLPPSFETLDQIEQDLEFRERFRTWFEAAAEDEKSSKAIKNALLLKLTPDKIESIARALHEHFDLVQATSSWPAPAAREALPGAAGMADRLKALSRYLDDCLEPTDRMYEKLSEVAFAAERLAEADTEGKALVALLLLDDFPVVVGKKGNWRDSVLYRLREELRGCLDEVDAILSTRRTEIFNGLLKELRGFVLAYAAERRRRGVGTFHGLLTGARDLLRDRPDVRARVQPEYRELVAEPKAGRGLWYFGGELARARQIEVWKREADDVARACRLVHDERWQVSRKDGEKQWLEDARWQDICVLIPTRTNLRNLERAFEAWQVPYRLESGELIVMTQEVRELVSCLRAIDDPSDQVALVTALRSPAYGCSDAELLRWRDSGGRFDYEYPGDGEEPRVRAALASLAGMHALRHNVTVPALVEKFLDERLLVAAAFGRPRPRETWRRYRYAARRARDFAATGRATLRSFVEWMEGLEREQYRDVGASTAEADDDAVRVLTIHGAKGLEFPVVMMTGWGSARRGGGTQVIPDRLNNRIEVGTGDWLTKGYKDALEREKRADQAEAVRLTYVGSTRARDHLVLSLWRREEFKAGEDPPPQAAGFEETLEESGLGSRLELESVLPAAEPPLRPLAQPTAAEHLADEEAWKARRDRPVQELGGLHVATATGLAHETDPELEGDDVATYRRGRGGTSFGRAVHAVLQSIDLASLAGLEQLARVQAAAERVGRRESEVVEAVRRARDSEPVAGAVRAARYWREGPAGAQAPGGAIP